MIDLYRGHAYKAWSTRAISNLYNFNKASSNLQETQHPGFACQQP